MNNREKIAWKKTKKQNSVLGTCWTITKELIFVFSRSQKERGKKIEKVFEKIMVKNFKFGKIYKSTDSRSQAQVG